MELFLPNLFLESFQLCTHDVYIKVHRDLYSLCFVMYISVYIWVAGIEQGETLHYWQTYFCIVLDFGACVVATFIFKMISVVTK